MNLMRSITSVGFYTIISRIAGYFRDRLMANALGVGPIFDAIAVTIKIPSLFRRLFAEGAFCASFVPMYSRFLAAGDKKGAEEFAEQVMSLMTLFLIGFIIVVELFLPWLMRLVVMGFDAERLELTIQFTRITFPFLLFIFMYAFFGGILNSYDRFVAASSAPFAANMLLIVVLLGIISFQLPMGYSIAWGFLSAGVVQMLWVFIPCRVMGVKLKFLMPRMTRHVKAFLRKMVPGAIGSGVVQINLFIGTMIASYLPSGGISYLYYADRLNQLPLSVIGTAVSTALLPLLSKQLRAGEIEEARHSQNRALEFSLLFAIPATLGLILLAKPLVLVLFEGGRFKVEDITPTAYALMAYASGLPAYILIKILNTGFFSRQDTKTPVMVAGCCVLVDIALSIALLKPMGHVGIALATSVTAWINVTALYILLYRQEITRPDVQLKSFFKKLVPLCLMTALFLKGGEMWLPNLIPLGILDRLKFLMSIIGSAVFLFLLAGWKLKIIKKGMFNKGTPPEGLNP